MLLWCGEMIKQHLKGKCVKVYVDLKKIADGDVEEEDRDYNEDDGDWDGAKVDGAIVTTNSFLLLLL